jgi:hypothetical protein
MTNVRRLLALSNFVGFKNEMRDADVIKDCGGSGR